MKKIIMIALAAGFVTSCSSVPGRVCGGSGGGRVVENAPKLKEIHKKPIV